MIRNDGSNPMDRPTLAYPEMIGDLFPDRLEHPLADRVGFGRRSGRYLACLSFVRAFVRAFVCAHDPQLTELAVPERTRMITDP